ncbi:MAG: sterol desaturase family protein [Crocinitomicaceae bacterium]
MRKQQKQRMYENPILELLSLSGPKMMIVFHLIVATLSILFGNKIMYGFPIGRQFLLFFSGILVWTFTEYVMHRYVFHWVGKSKAGKAFHYAMHGYHHDHPTDYNRLFMPPVPAILLLSLFFGLFYIFLGPKAWYFTPGFEIGYLLYSLVHYAVHTKMKFRFLIPLSLHHDIHHFRHSDKAYGVSSRFWDRVFGTLPDQKIHKQ